MGVFLASCHRDLSLTQSCLAEDIDQGVLMVAQPQRVAMGVHGEPSSRCKGGNNEKCESRKEAMARNTAGVRIYSKGVRKTQETTNP